MVVAFDALELDVVAVDDAAPPTFEELLLEVLGVGLYETTIFAIFFAAIDSVAFTVN